MSDNENKVELPIIHSTDDINEAIKKLQGDDKVGVVGEILATAGGVVAGGIAAGSIAAAAGATTILGSTSIAGVLGGVFVATTPVGWIAGCAAAGAAIAYGISSLVKSGGRNDRVREELIERFTKRLSESNLINVDLTDIQRLQKSIAEAISLGYMSENDANRIVNLVELGKLKVNIALARVEGLNEVCVEDSEVK